MSSILQNKKGITLVEAVIALFIAAIAIFAVAPMQDMAIRTAGRSDFLGRAAEIAQAEAVTREAIIMTPYCPTPPTVCPPLPPGYIDSVNQAVVVDNITFSVTTVTTHPAQNLWLVSVNVTWPGNVNGITNNRVITQQMGYP